MADPHPTPHGFVYTNLLVFGGRMETGRVCPICRTIYPPWTGRCVKCEKTNPTPGRVSP